MRRIVLMSIALAMALTAVSSVSAIQLFPSYTKLEVRRGETITYLLNVSNNSANPDSCQVYASGFEVLSNGKQLFEKANEKYSATKWLSIKEPLMEVPPGSVREIEVTIQVPRNAESGDYFASVFAETSSPSEIKTPQGVAVSISINMRLGSFLYITVTGQNIPKTAEATVQVEMPVSGNEEKDIKISTTLQNKCELRLDAQGEVLIKNSANRIFDKFILKGAGKSSPGEALVYPMGARNFSGTVRRPLPPGQYIAEVNFKYGPRTNVKTSANFKVSDELTKEQKSFLTLVAEPSFLKTEIPLGASRVLSLKVSNLELTPMKVSAVSQSTWIEIKPTELEIRPNQSKSLRLRISVPDNEQSTMNGKIILQPERGKPVVINVVVFPQKRK